MSNKEEIFGVIQSHPDGLDDDDISELTGIRPRQQVQQLCNQLASSNQIRRESVNKGGKRRKIHNFPMDGAMTPIEIVAVLNWKRRLAALVAATGESEVKLLEDALQLLALKVLRSTSEKSRLPSDDVD